MIYDFQCIRSCKRNPIIFHYRIEKFLSNHLIQVCSEQPPKGSLKKNVHVVQKNPAPKQNLRVSHQSVAVNNTQ